MELRHLRYFVRVAETLHFGRAAETLGIAQPPLSQQVRALEAELGVRLLARTSRRVALTEAGRLFLVEAQATLAQAERAIAVARRSALGEVGTLAIGFNPSAPFVPDVARALSDFRRTRPDVLLELAELTSTAQIAALAAGTIDAGFLRSPLPAVLPAGLRADVVREERLFVAMPDDHPLAARATLAFGDLQGEAMIFYALARHEGFSHHLLAVLAAHGVRPERAQDVGEIPTLLGLVAAGCGVTILVESLCALQTARLVYRPLAGPDASTTLWLVHAVPPGKAALAHFVGLVGGGEL